MRPLIAVSSLAALVLAIYLWSTSRSSTNGTQHVALAAHGAQLAALARLVAALDALPSPYALGVDTNGALVVNILEPPSYPENGSDEEAQAYHAFFERYGVALDAEADAIDGYATTNFTGQLVRSTSPDAVLAAGLSARPGRFASLSAAQEWYPDLSDEGFRPADDADRQASQDKFFDDYTIHRRHLFGSGEWRALQRTALQAMITCLDNLGTGYDLSLDADGELIVSPFVNKYPGGWAYDATSNKFSGGWADVKDVRDTDPLLSLSRCTGSPYIVHKVMGSGGGRRVTRGVRGRGRYDPDVVLAEGLSWQPGSRPISTQGV
ncbi:hypothetical protein Q8F55_008387 [Vanrija albida]|uniref:Uncharacterized protein n=1 Tax=Vanrija albida TaxID=181172 RepID=A0ABR3PWH9_9TREE